MNSTTAAPDYDAAARLAAVDEIARQLEQFELTPVTHDRLVEAMNVLDLAAAAARDAIPPVVQSGDQLAASRRNWSIHYAEAFRLAYDALNQVTNRKAVL
jgi:hypothetical protein